MNYDKEWDVIVVGAGPGGNMAGMEFAKRGMKTLVIERKQQIGPPKRCGEGLSMRWIKISDLKPNPRWAIQKINGVMLIAPDGKKVCVDTGKSGKTGYIIERSQWEKMEAEKAIRAGAKYMLKSLVSGLIIEEGTVKGVKVDKDGTEEEYRCKLVIACDGVDSMIGRHAGLRTAMPLTECDSGYQYEMVGVPMDDPEFMELYFGTDIAPRGYVWVFPKGKDVANVGIGINGNSPETAKKYLDTWLENNKERFKNASITEINAGVIPVTKPLDKFVANGLMLVGDSARMVNPIHGGGMGSALEAAIMAAEVGTKAIKDDDVSEKKLAKYEKMWRDKRGDEFKKVLRVRHFVEKMNDKQFNILADMVLKNKLDPKLFVDLSHGEGLVKLAKTVMKISPNAAKFAMAFLK